jgi:hypothetical protein
MQTSILERSLCMFQFLFPQNHNIWLHYDKLSCNNFHTLVGKKHGLYNIVTKPLFSKILNVHQNDTLEFHVPLRDAAKHDDYKFLNCNKIGCLEREFFLKYPSTLTDSTLFQKHQRTGG